tara:strand:- start:939 stop:1124 length:186 start_codon:yes stop_codon:yes gene_type:complete
VTFKRKKRNRKKRVLQKPKERNWIAQKAHTRTGAGAHKDKKKEASKRACRRKIDENTQDNL